MTRLAPSILLLALASLFAWQSLGATASVDPKVATAGNEQPKDGAILVNGWLIENHGSARILDSWERYQAFLSEPISGWDGKSQRFRGGELVYTPGNPPDWQVEFSSLGWRMMQTGGFTPSPGQTPHPALRLLIQSQIEVGIDAPRVIGRVISIPLCRDGWCWQYTDKQAFFLPEDAASADLVQRIPVGLCLAYPVNCAATTTKSAPRPGFDLRLAVAVALGAIGLLMLRGVGTNRGRSGGTFG